MLQNDISHTIGLIKRKPAGVNLTPLDYLNLLSISKPLDIKAIYFITDVRLSGRINENTRRRFAEYLQGLLDYTADLSSIGIYLKLFLPNQLRPYLHFPPYLLPEEIKWSDNELKKMLKMRVKAAGPDSVVRLFNSNKVPNPEATFIQVARQSPRRMLNFGNQLLLKHIAQPPTDTYISDELLYALADEFLKNDPA